MQSRTADTTYGKVINRDRRIGIAEGRGTDSNGRSLVPTTCMTFES